MNRVNKYVLLPFAALSFLFLLVAATQPTTPLRNAFLQSDLNGNGKSITNVATIKAANFLGGGSGLTNLNINGLSSTNNVLVAPRVELTNSTAPMIIHNSPNGVDLALLRFKIQSGAADVGGFNWLLTSGYLQLSVDQIGGPSFGGIMAFNDGEVDFDELVTAPGFSGSFSGNGSGLSLNGANIASGIVPVAVLPTSGAAPYWFKPWNRRQTVMQAHTLTLTIFGDAWTPANDGPVGPGTGNIVANAPTATQGSSLTIAGISSTGLGGETVTGKSFALGGINANYRTGRNLTFSVLMAVTNISSVQVLVGLTDFYWESGIDNPSGNYAMFLATTNTTSGYTNNAWIACTKDNTTQATTITSSAVDTNPHLFTITFHDSVPNVVFSIDGSNVATNTTHLPPTGTNLGYDLSVFCTANAISRGINVESMVIESDR